MSRVDTLKGNFLRDDIGSGYDYIWVSQILHSHNEDQCRLIIKKAMAALVPGGRLAIQDFFLNPDGYSPGAAMFGVHMLAVTPPGPGLYLRRSGGVDEGGRFDRPGAHQHQPRGQRLGGPEKIGGNDSSIWFPSLTWEPGGPDVFPLLPCFL